MASDLPPATSTSTYTEASIEVIAQELHNSNGNTQDDLGSISSSIHADSSSASALQQSNSQSHSQQTRFSFYEPELSNDDDDEKQQEKAKSAHANRFTFYNTGTGTGAGTNTGTTIGNTTSTSTADKDNPTPKSSTSSITITKREELTAVENIDNHNHNAIPPVTQLTTSSASADSSTDDILRSLQETEEQRLQLLSSTPTANANSNININVIANTDANNAYTKGRTTPSSNIDNNNNNHALPQSLLHQSQDEETSKQQQQQHTNEPSTSTVTSNTNTNANSSNQGSNNPYEDAIKEALDLLRKHRSPPPSPQVIFTTNNNETTTNTTKTTIGGAATATTSSLERANRQRPRTPREEDRVLKSRYDDEDDNSDSDEKQDNEDNDDDIDADNDDHQHNTAIATTDAYEEAKLKAKQRQERMRKYASRLEEFKSSLPQEQQQQQQQQQESNDDDNDNKSALHTDPGSPSRLSSLPRDVGSVLQQQQQQEPLSPLDLTLTLKQTGTTDASQLSVEPGLSDLSQSTRQNKQHEEEVQRGVERVLLAILERANTSSSRSRSSQQQSQTATTAATPVSVSVSVSASEPASVPSQSRTTPTMLQEETAEMDNVLLQAMEELLGQVSSVSASASGSLASCGGRSKQDASKRSRQTNSSVVDELLAEDEWNLNQTKSAAAAAAAASTRNTHGNGTITIPSPSSGMAMLGSPSSWNAQSQSQFTSSNHNQHKEEKKFESTEEPSSEEPTPFEEQQQQQQQQEPVSQQNSQNYSDIMNSCLLSSQENEDAQGEESEDAQDEDGSYQEDQESEAETDALDRVLGPLSKRSGGTTGVVLDLQTSRKEEEADDGSSTVFSNVMKEAESVISYVASVMSMEQPIEDQYPSSQKEKYSLDERDGDDEGDDVEAMELMKTLCAHLLPFGVVQSNQLQETIPTWDEDNATEAGYRIIRLTKTQLRRVEHSFESMIQNLKSNSETALEGYDANFVKELQEAERLLDDEERRLKAVEKAHDIVQKSNAKIQELANSSVVSDNEESDDVDDSDKDSVTIVGTKSHADFPGIKSAGHGEMGDLECFSLPIIFKSHVTGFEPTKEMVLEPGNIVAGQYLVESELGTAAFSTAYRCIDLSSEEDGEDVSVDMEDWYRMWFCFIVVAWS